MVTVFFVWNFSVELWSMIFPTLVGCWVCETSPFLGAVEDLRIFGGCKMALITWNLNENSGN